MSMTNGWDVETEEKSGRWRARVERDGLVGSASCEDRAEAINKAITRAMRYED